MMAQFCMFLAMGILPLLLILFRMLHRKTASQKAENTARPKAMNIMGPAVFVLIWAGVGIFVFVGLGNGAIEYDRKIAIIERDEVKPETLYVDAIYRQSMGDSWEWQVYLRGSKKGKMLGRKDVKVDDLQIGSAVTAYPCGGNTSGDGYLIPRFDRRSPSWARWATLVFGLLPASIFGGVLLVKTLRRRSPRESAQGTSTSKAFSRSLMSFDGVPDDSQLVCLLGDPDCGPIRTVEEAGVLTVHPWLFPMKFVVPWMVLTAVVVTGMMCFMPWNEPRFSSMSFWLPLLFLWLLCLPGFLVILLAVNRSFSKKGDYFKVDTARRTLELCGVSRTFKASEIIAITTLTRWYRTATGVWNKTHQTGILVRSPDSNRVELYPVVRELGENVPSSKKSKWADRLASIFQVPVRRIELSKSESRALNDC